ncbi:hypothetical protein [Actinophytocola glycyrrhizae]|uniref:Uncharacterized protein n=1 Tax=Actinophytocola glycyrrhizae TaxID=2044873 RepID=A0ABV9S1H7_9PSEU
MTGQERKARIEAQLGGIVGGETQGAIGGGQFTYGPDQLRQTSRTGGIWREATMNPSRTLFG